MIKLFPIGIPVSKRLFDLALTALGLILISPLLAVIAILLFLVQGRPVLFSQIRPGYKGVPFTVYKFCTMTNLHGVDGILLPDSERLTRLGRLLRSFSIDELPELINVLRGDMSLVGPRPLLMQYLDRYTPEQARRNDVLPGITGWAQVNGRNILTWEDKFRLMFGMSTIGPCGWMSRSWHLRYGGYCVARASASRGMRQRRSSLEVSSANEAR
jgi:lipopolysaccharide/colanic/teichoic acid biosynthesis glycosyltransferase